MLNVTGACCHCGLQSVAECKSCMPAQSSWSRSRNRRAIKLRYYANIEWEHKPDLLLRQKALVNFFLVSTSTHSPQFHQKWGRQWHGWVLKGCCSAIHGMTSRRKICHMNPLLYNFPVDCFPIHLTSVQIWKRTDNWTWSKKLGNLMGTDFLRSLAAPFLGKPIK